MKGQRTPLLLLAIVYFSIVLNVVLTWTTIMVFVQYVVHRDVPRWATDIETNMIVLTFLATFLSILIVTPVVLYDVFNPDRKVHPEVVRGLALLVVVATLYYLINATGLAVTGYIPY